MSSNIKRSLASQLKFGVSVLELCSGEEIAYDTVAIALAKVWIAALANLIAFGACCKGLSGQSQDGSEKRQLHDEAFVVDLDSL
jgi:hypothetical protein